MTGSGEHRLDLEAAKTDPCPPPEGAEVCAQSDSPSQSSPTWPKLRAVRLDLTTTLLDEEELAP